MFSPVLDVFCVFFTAENQYNITYYISHNVCAKQRMHPTMQCTKSELSFLMAGINQP